MSKDFDLWNLNKKQINGVNENKFYHQRDIWWCALGVNVGFEQDGTGENFQRPVLILKGFSKHVCLVVPLTTSLKNNPYHISLGTITNKPSTAIISQLRLVDTKRLINKIAVLNKEKFKEIQKAVRALL